VGDSFPHQDVLHRGQDGGLVNEVAEDVPQVQGFGGEGTGGRLVLVT
jgi:hypothetical protein